MNFGNIGNAVNYENTDRTHSTSAFPAKNKKGSITHKKSSPKKAFIRSSENFTLQKYFNDVGQEYTFNSKQELQFAIKIKLFESFHKKIK